MRHFSHFRYLFLSFTLAFVLGYVTSPVFAQNNTPASQDRAAIEADSLSYDEASDTVTAKGQVKIAYQGKKLRAGRIEWQQKKDILKAFDNVVLVDADGTTSYTDEAVISDQMREAVMQSLRVLMVDDSRLTGANAKRTGGNLTIINKASYTACKPCEDQPDKTPSWQIKTARTLNDETTQTIHHEDIRLEIMGLPVLYLPYISHPSPGVKKRSGFLTPSFNVSSDMGTDISTPYFINLAPNYDMTITPRVTSKAGLLLGLGFRHMVSNGVYEINANGLWVDEKDNKDNDREFRGNLSAKGKFSLKDYWEYGFQLESQTDETFLRRYNLSDQNYLESFAYVQKLQDKTYFDVRAKAYDTTLGSVDADTLPALLPVISYETIFDQKILDGDMSLNGQFMALSRDKGRDVMRATISGGWQRNFITTGGHLFNSFAQIRADAYRSEKNVSTSDPTLTYDDDVETRAIGYLGGRWSYPVVKYSDTLTQIIEPTAQIILSPNHESDPSIPNEDSLSIDFDNTNLFQISRYPGYDLIESGSRADIGLRYTARLDNNRNASLFVGQSLRRRKINSLVGNTGLEGRKSDYVVEFLSTPYKGVNFTSRLRLDKDDYEIVRSETNLYTSYGEARLNLGYVFLDKKLSSDLKEREEFRGSFNYKFANNWYFDTSIRQDMVRETRLNSGIGISYRDDCTYIRIGFSQDYVRDRNIGPSNNFSIQLNLKTLGGIATGTKMFE